MFKHFESLVEPFPADAPARPPRTIFQFCRYFSRGVERPLLAMAALSTVIAILEVVLFGFMGRLVDWLSTHSPETFLQQEGSTLIAVGLLVLLILPLLVVLQSLVVHQSLMGNFPMIVRWRAHQYLIEQSLAFFNNEFAGRIATKVMQTALAVREAVMKLMDIIVYVSVYFFSILVLVGSADARYLLPFLLWLLGYVLLLRKLVPPLKDISERQADARSMMTGRIVDSYTNIMTVKLFSHGRREADYAREGMGEFLDTVHPQMRLVTWLYGTVWGLNALLVFAVGALSIWLWLQGAVTAGAIAVAISLALRLNGMSQWIMWEVSGLFESIGTVKDGINLMGHPVHVLDAEDAQPLIATHGAIEFRDIRFDYGADNPVFDGLNLQIKPGERIGLVGRSGAGKSTLVNLLLRFYDVDDGEILVDSQNIRDVQQESLRAAIGVVTQDTSLMHRSVRDNIIYGRPTATDEELFAAACKAEAWDFIQKLSDPQGRRGFDAHVGERGVKLSGGQRQRVAIARVILKNAPILVLDEATSALDSEVEAAIQQSLKTLMQGKTVIAIAHRLSTIAAMDRLLVLDDGRIAESGTHSELVEQNGIYSVLWGHQSGGFIGTS